MQKRVLEDIVEEDLRKNDLSTRGEWFKGVFDNVIGRNPAITSTVLFFGLEYVRKRYPELIPSGNADLFVSYAVYSVLGLAKEYYLEGRKVFVSPKEFLLHNPKLVALVSAICAGIFTFQSDSETLKEFFHTSTVPTSQRMTLLNSAVAYGFQVGVVAEAITRGVKNLKRIKQSVVRLKTSIYERYYNYLFEHPIALSLGVGAYVTYQDYVSRSSHLNVWRLSGNLVEDLTTRPSSFIPLVFRTGLEVSLGLFGYLVAGSVLHSHSIREGKLRATKVYEALRHDSERQIDVQKRLVALPNCVERNIEDVVELGNLYYESGNRNEAFRYYRRAVRLFSKKRDHISYADFFRKSFGLDKVRRFFKRFSHKKNTEQETINGMFVDLLNKDLGAVAKIKGLVDGTPDDPKLRYLYGKALEVLGYAESGRRQKELAVIQVLSSGVRLKVLSGSKNQVALFDDDLLRDEVIAKCSSRDALERELNATNKLREILADFVNYDVPVPIGIVSIEGRSYYVMEQGRGELLSERIREGKTSLDEMLSVAGFMGLFHSRLKIEERNERDYVGTIGTRLEAVAVPSDVVRRITENLSPAVRSLDSVVRVCNRDGHPGNWQIGEFGGILGVDLECDRVVPLTFDTANLVDQYDIVHGEDKYAVLKRHLDCFRRYSDERIDIDYNVYKLAYLNSVIIRTLEIYSQVRTSNREVMVASLDNAGEAIERISKDFNGYYQENEREYRELNETIKILEI